MEVRLAGNEDDPKGEIGGPAPIPAREPMTESQRERLRERKHEAGLAREKAGREGRNDPYVAPEDPYAPRPQQHPHAGGGSKQSGGDAASGPDRTPDTSRGHRKH